MCRSMKLSFGFFFISLYRRLGLISFVVWLFFLSLVFFCLILLVIRLVVLFVFVCRRFMLFLMWYYFMRLICGLIVCFFFYRCFFILILVFLFFCVGILIRLWILVVIVEMLVDNVIDIFEVLVFFFRDVFCVDVWRFCYSD